jgi:hypothetical protein
MKWYIYIACDKLTLILGISGKTQIFQIFQNAKETQNLKPIPNPKLNLKTITISYNMSI